MVLQRITSVTPKMQTLLGLSKEHRSSIRGAKTKPSGAILPEPEKTRIRILGVICSIAAGLLIGAAFGKNLANFLEEHDLFVPSDDDDDDDD